MEKGEEQRKKESEELLTRRQFVLFIFITLVVITTQFWFSSIRDYLGEQFPGTGKPVVFLIAAIIFTIILFFFAQFVLKVPLNMIS